MKTNATMKEFRRRVRKHSGSPNPGEADCMYWLKHFESGLIVAALGHMAELEAWPVSARKLCQQLQTKVAKQWIKYDASDSRQEAQG